MARACLGVPTEGVGSMPRELPAAASSSRKLSWVLRTVLSHWAPRRLCQAGLGAGLGGRNPQADP